MRRWAEKKNETYLSTLQRRKQFSWTREPKQNSEMMFCSSQRPQRKNVLDGARGLYVAAA